MCTKSIELNYVIKELQTCTEDTVIFQKLINVALSSKEPLDDEYFKHWGADFEYIIKVFIPNAEIGRERALLASHTFFTLLTKEPSLAHLKSTFMHILKSTSNQICILDKKYDMIEPELFKLICTYGYLKVNCIEIYSDDVCHLIFDFIFEHCIKYTNYSYFAYKILYMWLQKTMNTNFWSTCTELEHKLEAIIFSNWCNSINEISKQNSTLIFNIYLKIMEKKYTGYIEHLFKYCVDTISWQNELKYDILAEICKVWDETKTMTSHDFLLSLCTSLTKYHLRPSGTKVYLAIVKKLSESEWKEAFGHIINYLFHYWESTTNENHNALQLLCKHWLEPVIKKYRNILSYLWDLIKDIKQHFLRSHLQKIASEMHIELSQQVTIESYIYHSKDIVRLNGFAINCYEVINIYNRSKDQFLTIRSFLWHNTNSATVYMRDGIVKYFKVFYANIIRMCHIKIESIQDIHYITHWLHEFLLNCFEIGSCYQRKILGLNLYSVILSLSMRSTRNKSNNIENDSCILIVEKHLKTAKSWKFTNKESLFVLLRLVLDSALDVKQVATSIILDYFDENILSKMEKQVLLHTALKSCNSSKFYEIESGAVLILILANWLPLNILRGNLSTINNYTRYSDFLLNDAINQLMKMKEDILKAVVQNEPFYGAMTALLKISFQNGPEKCYMTLDFIEKTLCLLEDAVEFFLSLFASKSGSREYSSSFAEMGLAIDEAIKSSDMDNVDFDDLLLTPAHQVLISCIWMSLKVSCEIACEIGILMHSDEAVKRSINIIVTTLLRCRHKGVVEAAGTTMGRLTRHLCKKAKYSDLLKIHIVRILEGDSLNSLNITRRGAGLSIMFHKIVVSDNRRDRPLLHFAVRKLLDFLKDFPENCLKNIESQHDSPWAKRLYFLRTLVADKEIHVQLIPYMERISLTCFRYLECEVWTIRNASLQLFGSIVPRLVGQSYGDTLDFGNGYSINHFVTHYPVLADYIMKELHRFSFAFTKFSTALYLHSNIVHILILLSKCSNSACNLINYSSQKYISQTKSLLRMLFENPVLYVRLLAAKAYTALTDYLEIKIEIKKLKYEVSICRNVNSIHSYLLTIKYLNRKLSSEMRSIDMYSNIKQDMHTELDECTVSRFRKILQIWRKMPTKQSNPQICYVLEVLFLQLKESISEGISDKDIFLCNENVFLLLSERIKPGFFQYVELATKLYADYIKRTNNINIDILRSILNFNYPCIDQSISFLNHVSHCTPILKIVLEHLLLNECHLNDLLLNAMIKYVLETLKQWSLLDINKLNIEEILKTLTVGKLETTRYSNLQNLKCILLLMFSQNELMINEILSHALQLSIHEEEHMRRIAVEFVQFSIHRFSELTDKNKLSILYCCLILLKDEISEIREVIVEYLRSYVLQLNSAQYIIVEHDECIYQKLLSDIMLGKLNFPTKKDTNLSFIKLFTSSIQNFNVNNTIQNPFTHEDSSFYKEESKFLNLCFYYINENKHSHDKCPAKDNTIKCNIGMLNKPEMRYQLQNKCSFNDANLEDVLNTKYVDYLLQKQKIIIQEYS